MRRIAVPPALGVFLILFASDAFFWHSRDWNASSRLMLTYSLVDRVRVDINGLEDHTRDRARIGPRYFSDKQPGYSLLAAVPYAIGRGVFGLPPHPLNRKGDGFTHWPSDYWIALFTSGLLTSACGALLTNMASGLGCGPRRAALVGLAYGLATPAYVYATLNYGHQATAFSALAAFACWRRASSSAHASRWAFLAGLTASMASLVELQAAPISAILAAYGAALALGRRVRPASLAAFAIGAAIPLAILLAYDAAAFGSPFDMGYFHEDLDQFQEVHSAANPLGLGRFAWGRGPELLWGEHRGLLVFAPILLLAPIGWGTLALSRRWDVLGISASVCAAVFLVNLSYPEWTGGWSTGPRLLVPLLPFAMLGVAAALGSGPRWLTAIAVVLALLGGVEMMMFQGVGGRVVPAPEGIDSPYAHPFRQVVWPLWRGDRPRPGWIGGRFDRNLVSERFPEAIRGLPDDLKWLQFAPLLVGQAVAIGLLMAFAARPQAIERAGGAASI